MIINNCRRKQKKEQKGKGQQETTKERESGQDQ
jgi:hypothetical protein